MIESIIEFSTKGYTMPKNVTEEFPDYQDFKTISVKVDKKTWERILMSMRLKSKAAGCKYTLQRFFTELFKKAI